MMALAGASVIVAAVAGGTLRQADETVSRLGQGPQRVAEVPAATQQRVLQSVDGWLSESYWRRKRLKRQSNRNAFSGGDNGGASNPFSTRPQANTSRPAPQTRRYNGTYRTVCVRLCDGYYFPVSFSTTRDRLDDDERACSSRCNAPTKLYFYSAEDGSPETMVDRQGRKYADLNTAFVYRTTYDKSCQCRAQPWSDEAKQRHAMYQTEGWKRKARVAAREAKEPQRRIVRRVPTSNEASDIETGHVERGVSVAASAGEAPESESQQRYRRGRMSLGNQAATARRARRTRRAARPQAVQRRRQSWKRQAFTSGN